MNNSFYLKKELAKIVFGVGIIGRPCPILPIKLTAKKTRTLRVEHISILTGEN